MLESLAVLAREPGHFPVNNEIKLKARTEPGFPWHSTFARFGGKLALVKRLREFCATRGYEDVVALCDVAVEHTRPRPSGTRDQTSDERESVLGYVYLLKSGRFYKIGRTNVVGRRERELSIQLPEKATVIHSIKTDDLDGIETYWHGRFSDRRKNGEWLNYPRKMSLRSNGASLCDSSWTRATQSARRITQPDRCDPGYGKLEAA